MLDAEGYYQSARHDLGEDGVWIWRPIAEGGGKMPPSPFEAGPRWREGVVTEESETRKVVLTNGWSEAYPKYFNPEG